MHMCSVRSRKLASVTTEQILEHRAYDFALSCCDFFYIQQYYTLHHFFFNQFRFGITPFRLSTSIRTAYHSLASQFVDVFTETESDGRR